MTPRRFRLAPFPGTLPPGRLEITGSLARRGRGLALGYELRGDLESLALPGPAALPGRRGSLWEDTCLEIFLASGESPRYWEFNLSPAGHWNVFAFDGYRRGMREEAAFAALPFTVRREAAALILSLEIDLSLLLPAAPMLTAAIAAVINTPAGEVTYWALRHPGPRPDFHRRDAFLIAL